jgi:hypothetical protein
VYFHYSMFCPSAQVTGVGVEALVMFLQTPVPVGKQLCCSLTVLNFLVALLAMVTLLVWLQTLPQVWACVAAAAAAAGGSL